MSGAGQANLGSEITVEGRKYVHVAEAEARQREASAAGYSSGHSEGLAVGQENAEEEFAAMDFGEVLEGRLERHDALAIAGVLEQSRHLFSDVRQHALTQVIDALYGV